MYAGYSSAALAAAGGGAAAFAAYKLGPPLLRRSPVLCTAPVTMLVLGSFFLSSELEMAACTQRTRPTRKLGEEAR